MLLHPWVYMCSDCYEIQMIAHKQHKDSLGVFRGQLKVAICFAERATFKSRRIFRRLARDHVREFTFDFCNAWAVVSCRDCSFD